MKTGAAASLGNYQLIGTNCLHYSHAKVFFLSCKFQPSESTLIGFTTDQFFPTCLNHQMLENLLSANRQTKFSQRSPFDFF